MHPALTDLYRAKWSNDIHEEWIRSLLENRPDLTRHQLVRVRDLMNANVRDCLVTGYEDLIPALSLPDANDRHVLAAAIRGQADVIVTYDTKDFPAAVLDQYGITAQHPDEFIYHLIDLDEAAVVSAARAPRRNLKNPRIGPEEFVHNLERRGLVQTASFLRKYVRSL